MPGRRDTGTREQKRMPAKPAWEKAGEPRGTPSPAKGDLG